MKYSIANPWSPAGGSTGSTTRPSACAALNCFAIMGWRSPFLGGRSCGCIIAASPSSPFSGLDLCFCLIGGFSSINPAPEKDFLLSFNETKLGQETREPALLVLVEVTSDLAARRARFDLTEPVTRHFWFFGF